jgi:hypothetical protein
VRLTVNPEQDYWPTWTADGRGILYSFIAQVPGSEHRCLGILPAAGGTRVWEFCDNRAAESDSLNSFAAYALDNAGQLLYAESESLDSPQRLNPGSFTLWLADTANPLQRRALLTLPMPLGGVSMAWLADIAWTGPAEFTALAQTFDGAVHCKGCVIFDSLFGGIGVVRGTIGPSGATLALIAGTEGASGYSSAESGSSIVFTKPGNPGLFKVPAGGGTAITVTQVGAGAELLGVSCVGSTCVVATDPIADVAFIGTAGNPATLRAVSLATGASQIVFSDPLAVVATPEISPAGHDVVAQRGGVFGHLRTVSSQLSDLHLFPGLLP